jgi:hypothetical protein
MSTELIKSLRRNYLPANEDQAFLWLLYTAKHSEGAN